MAFTRNRQSTFFRDAPKYCWTVVVGVEMVYVSAKWSSGSLDAVQLDNRNPRPVVRVFEGKAAKSSPSSKIVDAVDEPDERHASVSNSRRMSRACSVVNASLAVWGSSFSSRV